MTAAFLLDKCGKIVEYNTESNIFLTNKIRSFILEKSVLRKNNKEVKVKKRNKAVHQVVEYLENSIAQGTYLPGEKLNMADIANKLGISRIPISEAFQYMGKQGLIELYDNRGAYVKKYTIQEAYNIYQAWTQLEIYSCKLMAVNRNKKKDEQFNKNFEKQKKAVDDLDVVNFTILNRDFHLLIAKSSGNDYLVELIDNILKRVTMFRMLSLWSPKRIQESYQQHLDLYQAILKNDAKLIEEKVICHMETGFEYLKNKNNI